MKRIISEAMFTTIDQFQGNEFMIDSREFIKMLSKNHSISIFNHLESKFLIESLKLTEILIESISIPMIRTFHHLQGNEFMINSLELTEIIGKHISVTTFNQLQGNCLMIKSLKYVEVIYKNM